MKTLLADSTVDLDQYLSCSQPIVVSSPPFSGNLRVPLHLRKSDDLRVVVIGKGRKEVRPRYLANIADIPSNFLSIFRYGSDYVILFCLSHQGVSAALEGEGDDCVLCLKGDAEESFPVLICVHGENLYQSLGLALRMGIRRVCHSAKLREEKPPIHHWMNALGWESGGAFGDQPSHDKIISAVWSLRQEGIQPGYVLIDDGWQWTASKGGKELLHRFDADPQRFPQGLSGLVKELQRAGVHHVGVSHSILGSSGGISKEMVERYQLTGAGNPKGFLGFDLGKTFQFYHDYYEFLSREGISFTKVKRQTDASRELGDPALMTRVYPQLQSAIQAASSLHFEAPHLNSECLTNENLFYWTTSRIASTADDLDTQSRTGAKKAIRNLLANGCWMQRFMHPDFNSWSTDYPHSPLLAILHALSSSINVISDPPGRSNVGLLKKSVLPSGRLIKTDFPLLLCESSLFVNPLKSQKLYKGFAHKGETGLLALFNLTRKKKPVQEYVSASEVEGIVGDAFAVYSHANGYLGVFGKEEQFPVAVKQNEADVLTFSPIRNGVALIGCYHYFVPSGPIQETTFEEESMHITSIVTSPMLMYSEQKVMDIRRNGQPIPWDYDKEKKLLVIDSRRSQSEITTVYTINFE